MFYNRFVGFLRLLLNRLVKPGDIGVSMRIRLFGFLVLLVVTMLSFVALILALTGVIVSGHDEAEKLIQQKLSYLSQNVEKMYGDTSVQTVILSETMSKSIEDKLQELGFTINELRHHPEVLERLLEGELTRLMLALEKTKCSGVFVVLDATVNPALPGSEHSKAGIYLRNSEPNIITADASKLYLRGPAHIALANKLSLQAKWDMEFNVEEQPYYNKPIEAYQKNKLPVSRLYYWSYGGAINNLDEKVMLCSAPLICSKGEAFGVCGFEISETNFKLQFSPDESIYSNALCVIALSTAAGFDAFSLCSGNAPALQNSLIRFAGGMRNLSLYENNNIIYAGLHKDIKIYPVGSPFASDKNAVALLLPQADLVSTLSGYNNRIAFVCALALFFGVILSVYVSRQYVKPIFAGLDVLRSKEDLDDDFRINIPEIDELVELIKSKQTPAPKNISVNGAGEDFLRRLETLTPTERDIFTLYVKGNTANEAADKMNISINTVKTHSKKIYVKMKVASRAELLSYCIGLADRITID
ncbi:MAG: LuxR C-terminal-related transcriptional regulator [Synergistaceae bacterium]|nr:LuxR C-terminal-related transcriptional regulator [Synergistaceae bacterium]